MNGRSKLGPNVCTLECATSDSSTNLVSDLTMVVSSPEKAGVGGSIPSLATNDTHKSLISMTPKPEFSCCNRRSRSKSVQLTFTHNRYPVEFVYFVQIVRDRHSERNGLIKIGRSKYPGIRATEIGRQHMAQLQILGWTNGEEREWHNAFDWQLFAGEWFWPTEELMNAIREHCNPSRYGRHCFLPTDNVLTAPGPCTLRSDEVQQQPGR